METIGSNTIEKHSIVYSTEGTLPAIEKVVYTGKTHTTGGRDGASLSSDGRLDTQVERQVERQVKRQVECRLKDRLKGRLKDRFNAG